jgi:hypothetical protein
MEPGEERIAGLGDAGATPGRTCVIDLIYIVKERGTNNETYNHIALFMNECNRNMRKPSVSPAPVTQQRGRDEPGPHGSARKT